MSVAISCPVCYALAAQDDPALVMVVGISLGVMHSGNPRALLDVVCGAEHLAILRQSGAAVTAMIEAQCPAASTEPRH